MQFVLGSDPLSYEGLDYLEPIFTELKPPLHRAIALEHFTLDKTINSWREEFFTRANISYYKRLREKLIRITPSDNEALSYIRTQSMLYAYLKFLKMDYAVDEISNYLIDDPGTACHLVAKYALILEPIFYTFHANCNLSLSTMKMYDLTPASQQITFPVEIGRYLMKKLVLYPSTYNGCIHVIQHYEANDLYRIVESLDRGIKNQNIDNIVKNAKELDAILDNIWKDAARLNLEKEGVHTGISLALGIVGDVATSMLGGFGGLLAKLGFKVAERWLEMKDYASLSDKIVRLINRDYLVNIYDFQQKYRIRS